MISLHVLGMFAFSPVWGALADRMSKRVLVLIGALVLMFGCLLGPVSNELIPIEVALFFVGLGWSICYVSGSALLTGALTREEKARAQGSNDLIVNLSSALGGLASGLILSQWDYLGVGTVGVVLISLPILVMLFQRMRPMPAAAA